MSHIHAAEKIRLDKAAIQEMEMLSPQVHEPKDHPSQTGLALHQLFNQDIFTEVLSQSVDLESITPSLWQRILDWFKGNNKVPPSEINSKKGVKELADIQSDAISPVPVLDTPTYIPEDLKNVKLSTLSKKDDVKTRLTFSEIEEMLSLMSDQTIESIMFIIFKIQIQLEKENANVAETTFSKYLDFQKLQQEILIEIKDVLMDDKNIATHFGTAQNIALLANFMAGIVTVAISFNIVGPVWGFLSTTAAAGLTVTTLGGKAYFQRRMNEHKAKHEIYAHHDQYYNDRIDDSRNRLMATAEADTVFKERWIQLLRRSDKMRKLVFKK